VSGKDKYGKCKGKMKSNFQYEIVVKRAIVSFQTHLEWRLKVKVDNYREELGNKCLCLYISFLWKNCQVFTQKGVTL
jgi:hypothetical protein